MATIKVLAGDLKKGKYGFYNLYPIFMVHNNDVVFTPKDKDKIFLNKSNIKTINVLTEDNKKKLVGTAGWGFVGLIALGPLGAIGGLLIGGRKKEVTFVCEFNDGKKIMAHTDSKTYQKLMAENF